MNIWFVNFGESDMAERNACFSTYEQAKKYLDFTWNDLKDYVDKIITCGNDFGEFFYGDDTVGWHNATWAIEEYQLDAPMFYEL